MSNTIFADNIAPAIIFYQPLKVGVGEHERLILGIGTDKTTGEVLIVAKKPEEVVLVNGYLQL